MSNIDFDPTAWGAVPAGPASWGAIPVAPSGSATSAEDRSREGRIKTRSGDLAKTAPEDRMAGQMLFGFGDELGAELSSRFHPKGLERDEELESRRRVQKNFETENPGTAMAIDLGGAIATAPIIPLAGARAATLAGKMAGGAITGGALGAVYGAGTGEDVEDRAQRAAQGLVIGGVTGAVAPPLIEGGVKVASKLGDAFSVLTNPVRTMFQGADKETARRAGRVMAEDLAQPGGPEALRRTGDIIERSRNVDVPFIGADVGETTGALLRSSANKSPTGRQVAEDVIGDRYKNQSGRLEDFVRNLFTGKIDSTEAREALRIQAAKANRPAYTQAYADGADGVWTPELERLVQSPDVQTAIREAQRRAKTHAIAEGHPPPQGAFEFTPDGRTVLKATTTGNQYQPSAQLWDYVARELKIAVEKGTPTEKNFLGNIRKQILGEVDKIVPSFGKARSGAAQFFGAQDALEAGEKFALSRGTNPEMISAYAKFNPAEKELFSHGFASNLIQKIREGKDRTNILNQIDDSPAARERMNLALGPQKASAILLKLRTESIMDKTRQALGNSTTARQLVELGIGGSATGYGAMTGDLKTAGGVIGALLARRGLNALDAKVSRHVAELLTSGDPAMFRRAAALIEKNPNVGIGLRQVDSTLSRLVAPSAADIGPRINLPGGVVPSRAEDQPEQ